MMVDQTRGKVVRFNMNLDFLMERTYVSRERKGSNDFKFDMSNWEDEFAAK